MSFQIHGIGMLSCSDYLFDFSLDRDGFLILGGPGLNRVKDVCDRDTPHPAFSGVVASPSRRHFPEGLEEEYRLFIEDLMPMGDLTFQAQKKDLHPGSSFTIEIVKPKPTGFRSTLRWIAAGWLPTIDRAGWNFWIDWTEASTLIARK